MLEFTNKMKFPNTEDFVRLNKRSGYKLIDLLIFNSDDGTEDKNLLSWEIVSVSPT